MLSATLFLYCAHQQRRSAVNSTGNCAATTFYNGLHLHFYWNLLLPCEMFWFGVSSVFLQYSFRILFQIKQLKILIIEDEKALSDSIATYLKSQDYICETAVDFKTAIEKTELYEYDCILLDITLPGGNGLTILKELRANNKTDAILIISAKNSVDDKVAGLTLGADDYLPKPFHLSELSARVAAIIRRKQFGGCSIIHFNNITIDTTGKVAAVNKMPLDLTKKEFELLLYFVSNKGRVISKSAIAEHLWGDEMEGNLDFIYTHIKNLRKKLTEAGDADYIKSVYGMGYKFTD
jgi:DNA-binding response OmpR family regulator